MFGCRLRRTKPHIFAFLTAKELSVKSKKGLSVRDDERARGEETPPSCLTHSPWVPWVHLHTKGHWGHTPVGRTTHRHRGLNLHLVHGDQCSVCVCVKAMGSNTMKIKYRPQVIYADMNHSSKLSFHLVWKHDLYPPSPKLHDLITRKENSSWISQ